MFPQVYVIKQKSELSDKSDRKQYLGPKTILIVLLVILSAFALFLPFRFYHGNKHPDILESYFGAWYKSPGQIPSSNDTHVFVEAPRRGYIKLELQPHSSENQATKGSPNTPVLSTDTSDAAGGMTQTKANCDQANVTKHDCHSRRKRSNRSRRGGYGAGYFKMIKMQEEARKNAAEKKKKEAEKKKRKKEENQYYESTYDAYLKCLEGKTEAYFEQLASKPNVVLGEEETTIILKCNMCLRADHDYEIYNYHWERFLKHSPNQTWEDIKEEENHFEVDPVTGDIVLNNMLEEDSGRYVCYAFNNAFQAVHYLDVLGMEKTRQVFDASVTPAKDLKQLETAKNHTVKLTKAAPPEPIDSLNLLVFTTWTEWTKCTRCGVRGERSRHGQCTVKIADPQKDTEYDILKKFPEGLPCRSSLVPRNLADVKQVKERYSENELGYCTIDCPKEPKKILDENGNPVKVFKNPLKRLRRPKWMPKLPKLVVRRTYYVVTGKKTALKCPNTRNGQAVRWSNGSQVYDRIQMAQDIHHRVSIDTSSRLIVHNLQQTDTAVYTCYVYGKLQGSLKLKVVPPYKEEGVSDWITTAGLVGTVLLIFYLGFMLCQQEKKYGKVMH